jgi:hypothetical protein
MTSLNPEPAPFDPADVGGGRTDRLTFASPGDAMVRGVTWSLIVGVLVAAAAAVLVLAGSKTYESRAALLLDQPRAIAASQSEGYVTKLVRLRSKYASLATTDAVLEGAAASTGLRIGRLRRETFATAPDASMLLVIGGRSDAGAVAAREATAVARSLIEYVDDEQSALPADERLTLRVVTPARPGGRVAPTTGRVLTVGLVGGAVAAVLTYVALALFRAVRRNA